MPSTIFWRSILAQMALIVLIGGGSLYALSQINRLTSLSAEVVARDEVFIDEAKRLVRIFLAQMRNAEKYALLRDKAFYTRFIEASGDFENCLKAMMKVVYTAQEGELLQQIQNLHGQYTASLTDGPSPRALTSSQRSEIGRGITARVDELIRLREASKAQRSVLAHERAVQVTRVVTWMTLAGIGLAVLLAYIHAHSVSRPLKRLAHELHSVGRGEFHRSLDIRAPEEVKDLLQAFNWMAVRLAKLDDMKADFIDHISHELRTPLTGMREGTAMLWEEIPGPLTASQRDIVAVLRSHSDRLSYFLSSVLDLSKMEAGMMEYVRVPSDLLAVLDRSVESVQLMAQRKSVHIEVVSAAALPLLLLDEARMQQAFDNLLSNAVKFTPKGGKVRVGIAFTTRERFHGQGRWIEVQISDTGEGIPAEECEHIFHRFYQSPHHRCQSDRGTGLGLAMTRHIIEAHGGRIWVESQVDRGSTFFVLLPARKEVFAASMPADLPPSAVASARPTPLKSLGE